MRCVLLHYHIFKNAGSTIEEIFERSFGRAFSRVETSDSEGIVSNQELVEFLERNRSTKAISSHQIRYPTPKIAGFLFFDVCLLRDPIDRIRSIYDFYHPRPATGDPLSELAQGSLGEFVRGLVEGKQLYVKNVQVNQLACAGDSDEPEERDFQLAAERIRRAAFPGLVHCFNKSMVAGEHRLRSVFPELDCALPAENVTGGLAGSLAERIEKVRSACDESVYAELLRLNALDIRLVNCAHAEIERRFRLVPDADARLEEFERRIGEPPGRRVGPCVRRRKQETRHIARLEAAPGSARSARPNWYTRLRRLAGMPRDAFILWRCLRRYETNLFDADYYRESYPEIGPTTNPLIHFLLRGAFELKKPHPLFDPAFYLAQCPEVGAAGLNPLSHYLRRAANGHRQPTPFFDSEFYLERNPDVRKAGIPPLLHYVRHGAAEGRKPHPLFEPGYYARCGFGMEIGAHGLLAHFAESGADACNPHPLFDCESYLSRHPNEAAQNRNPLADYLGNRAGPPAYTRGSESAEPALKRFAAAQIVIADVPVVVVFQGDGWPPAQNPGQEAILRGGESRVLVSKDDSGAARIEAEPQQQPFFEAIPVEQLFAQVNSWITYGLARNAALRRQNLSKPRPKS
ncbi:MAG TPA: hypothetical protein VKV17_08005 [Bryobacteraceae bacterium]|nr:hypothetical protein [Bryobacteraceae bacterium]